LTRPLLGGGSSSCAHDRESLGRSLDCDRAVAIGGCRCADGGFAADPLLCALRPGRVRHRRVGRHSDHLRAVSLSRRHAHRPRGCCRRCTRGGADRVDHTWTASFPLAVVGSCSSHTVRTRGRRAAAGRCGVEPLRVRARAWCATQQLGFADLSPHPRCGLGAARRGALDR